MMVYTCVKYTWHNEGNNDCTEPKTCNNTENCNNICTTIYRNKGGGLAWLHSGCRIEHKCHNDVDECILRHFTQDIYLCCCSSPLCNRNIVVNATHMTPKTTIPTTSKTVCLV